ncbi:hypothetical protein AA313_de0209981 [Arthrobotrys entomopaga]|nr:hypothetical protein AA313_de0209981 [Arthrobotrys entomopaga]
MQHLDLQDLWNLLLVSRDFEDAYKESPEKVIARVGRNSFRYDQNFAKYFPIEYHGSWLEESNKNKLPFPGWQRHLYHLQLLLSIEEDLFEVSKWIHWGSCYGNECHETGKDHGNNSSCSLYIHTKPECGRTYSALIDFAQKSLYGPSRTTSELPNSWDHVLTISHRPGLKTRKSMSFRDLEVERQTGMPPKYHTAFRDAINTVELMLVHKLWYSHSRPIPKPCCWNNRFGDLTLPQRPRRFVQIAPFKLMLNLFHCKGDLKCAVCDTKNGIKWNDVYTFSWELATYWAASTSAASLLLENEDWMSISRF